VEHGANLEKYLVNQNLSAVHMDIESYIVKMLW